MCLVNAKRIKKFSITSSLKQNKRSLLAEIYCGKLGAVLLLTNRVDSEAKKLLK